MLRSLKNFPEDFMPLVVVVGDRREHRPKTIGDLLAYSVSTVDLLYISMLNLPEDTLILSDKIFCLEKKEFLKEKFGDFNILTIGSPAANLFSRIINESSIFKFSIEDSSWIQLYRHEQIIRSIKRDRIGLRIYKLILEEGAQSVDDIVKAYSYKLPKSESLARKFDFIFEKIQDSGLTPQGYRELLRALEGSGIIDPISNNEVNFDEPKKRGKILDEYNDFGLISFAKHPFTQKEGLTVIYAAGRHGPATSHSIRWLSDKEIWGKRPYGGVFEVLMDTSESFSTKFQETNILWDTDEYSENLFDNFNYGQIKNAKPFSYQHEPSTIFISTPLRRNNRENKDNTRWLAETIQEYCLEIGLKVICKNPYDLYFKGQWNYVNGILKHFPPARFIMHDITNFSPGVVFEVGCSIGLKKRFVLFWDTSKVAIQHDNLPNLLKFTNIREIKIVDKVKAKKEIINVVKAIETDNAELNTCPGYPLRLKEGEETCDSQQLQKIPPDQRKVFVVVNDKWSLQRDTILEQVKKNGYVAVLQNDFPDHSIICRICKGIVSSEHAIVDVTENDMDGLLSLGMARARQRKVLQILKEGSDASSMFDGLTVFWREDTIKKDIANMLPQFLKK